MFAFQPFAALRLLDAQITPSFGPWEGAHSSLLPGLFDVTLVIFHRNLSSELRYDLNRQMGHEKRAEYHF